MSDKIELKNRPKKKDGKYTPLKRSPEEKKLYQQIRDKKRIVIRLTDDEATSMELMMKEADWDNRAGFAKFKIFGYQPKNHISQKIKEGDTDNIEIIIKHSIQDLIDNYSYIRKRYDKDMNTLIRLEEYHRFENVTMKWITKLEKDTEKLQATLDKICKSLGI